MKLTEGQRVTREVADLEWRKISYSGSRAACVELASLRHHILVRDARNPARASECHGHRLPYALRRDLRPPALTNDPCEVGQAALPLTTAH
ncbi:DUF397 domain-containing protein [Nonomuraea sp. NPDC048881]|uniref:DUF397 domain-containing protein n=1 Tax=Nonomuraea sp. NPDC048881 TaxID=3155030 RepID=UPI0033D211AF